MRKQEQRLWDTMSRNAPREFWMQRVENVCVPGMPDVHVSHPSGSNAWVELKAPRTPTRVATRLLGNEGLSLEQINWHLKAASMNQRSYVLIRDSDRNLFLAPSRLAAFLNDMPVAELRKNSLAADWRGIFEALA